MKGSTRKNNHRRPFRFEAAWETHQNFYSFVASNWEQSASSSSCNIDGFTQKLKRWNRDTFGCIWKKKVSLKIKIDWLDGKIGVSFNPRVDT